MKSIQLLLRRNVLHLRTAKSITFSAHGLNRYHTASLTVGVSSQQLQQQRLYHSKQMMKNSPFTSTILKSQGQTPIFLQSHRTLLHIPIIGLVTPKILAALALKKTVVLAILRKYGVKGTFDILRESNAQLGRQLGSTAYPPSAQAAVSAGLSALEMSVSKLEITEQAEVIWKWLKTVDSTLYVESLKKLVDFSPKPTAVSFTPEEQQQTEDVIKAIKDIASQFPDIQEKYDIILVKKEVSQNGSSS
jgi:hypothetical protein